MPRIRAALLFAAALPLAAPTAPFVEQAGSTGDPEIIVTATGLQQRVNELATPLATLTGEELVKRRQTTLGETLAGQPGIHFDNFGAGRPVMLVSSSRETGGASEAGDCCGVLRRGAFGEVV